MAVALDAADSERGADGEVLRQGDGADVGEGLARNDIGAPRPLAPPLRGEGDVGDALEYALAVLVTRARIAERPGDHHGIRLVVGFVDDEGRAVRPAIK